VIGFLFSGYITKPKRAVEFGYKKKSNPGWLYQGYGALTPDSRLIFMKDTWERTISETVTLLDG
jgi:hypothetical protein